MIVRTPRALHMFNTSRRDKIAAILPMIFQLFSLQENNRILIS